MIDNIGAYVARLIELGVPAAEAATIAAEIFVAGVQASAYRNDVKPRSAGANRTARWRERKASQNVTERHGDVTVTQSPEVSPAPLPNPSKNPPKGGQKGSRINPDWRPSEADLLKAREAGLSEAQISREAERFRDYWLAKPGKDGSKADWPATWRNWVRSSADRLGLQPRTVEPDPPIPKAVPASSPEELDRRKRQAVANGYWSQMLWGPVPDDIRERVNVQ